MTAQDVYNIAQALPKDELIHLYNKLWDDFNEIGIKRKKKKGSYPFTTNVEAQLYIFKAVFSKEKVKKRNEG